MNKRIIKKIYLKQLKNHTVKSIKYGIKYLGYASPRKASHFYNLIEKVKKIKKRMTNSSNSNINLIFR